MASERGDAIPPTAVVSGDLYHGLFSWCTFREKTKSFEELAKLVRDVRIMGPEFGFSAVRTVEMTNPSDLRIIFLLTARREVALAKDGREIKAVYAPEYAPPPEDPISAPGETLYPYLFTNTGDEGDRLFEYGENAFEMKAGDEKGVKSLPFALTVLRPETAVTAKGPKMGAGMTIKEGEALTSRGGAFARMTIPGAKRAAKKAKQTGNPADCLVTHALPGCVQDSGRYCEIQTNKSGDRVLYPAVYNVCEERWEPQQKGRPTRSIGMRYVASRDVVSEFAKQEFSLEGLLRFLKDPLNLPSTIMMGMVIEASQMPEWVITYRPSEESSPPSSENPFPSAPVTENKR